MIIDNKIIGMVLLQAMTTHAIAQENTDTLTNEPIDGKQLSEVKVVSKQRLRAKTSGLANADIISSSELMRAAC